MKIKSSFEAIKVPAQMVWIDMETTGLQPPEGRPNEVVLEVGCIVTDIHGNEKASFESLVLNPDWREMLSTASDFVQRMHLENGLISDLTNADKNYRNGEMAAWNVDIELRDFLNAYAGEPNEMPLCGSTINFDRHFLGANFEESFRWFHYRNVDITTIRELAKRLAPSTYANRTILRGGHRCLSDIRASIAEYKFFKDNFLNVTI